MFKKLILASVFIFLFSFNLAQAAGVIINEFVPDPDSGSEWIELLNTSSSEIDLNNWNWTELASPGTNTEHESSPKNLSGVIPIGGIFVFEMNSALNNSGDSIGLYNGTDLQDRVSFGKVNNYSKNLEIPDKGKSGALISGVWETNQEPTKGTANQVVATVPPVDNSVNSSSNSSSSSSTSSSSSSESKPKVIENPTMKVKILANTLAFTGQPLEIKTNVTGFSNENVVLGKASWNFGDGSSFEQINNFEKFSHIYYYPGEYVLFLEYYQNSFSKDPDAISKIIIKVISTTVIISKVGDVKDFFIELSNNASSDIDISNWIIKSGEKTFILPKNSVIMSKKLMTISGKITGFSYGDQNNLKLYSKTGELVYDYSSSTARKDLAVVVKPKISPVNFPAVEPLENLEASALQSNVIGSDAVNSSIPLIPIASILFVGASASIVYFIRQKKVIPESGNDFEILDE